MVFPFTVPLDLRGRMRDPVQGVYARSLARMLAERLSLSPQMSAVAATLTATGPVEGLARTGTEEGQQGWVVASQPWTVDEACHAGLSQGREFVLHGVAELTDRIRLRILLVDRPRRALALDHVVLRPRAELFAALEEAAGVVAQALGEELPQARWPTSDVEAYVAYLRGRDVSAAHESGVRVPDPSKSFDAYLEAARRDPDFLDAQDRLLALALDFALGGQGPIESARASCERLLQLDPTAHKAHATLAEMDLALGDAAGAEARLQKVLRLRPDWGPAWERMGAALLQQDRYLEALPWFEKALKEQPDDAEALVGFGIALLENDRLEEAAAAWHKALEFGARTPHLHENLAAVLSRLGRRAEARRHRRAARHLAGRPKLGLGLFVDAWQWLTGAA